MSDFLLKFSNKLKICKTNNKETYIQLIDRITCVVLITLFVFLPSASIDGLMQGTTSGKMFYFLYFMIIVGILMLWKGFIHFPLIIRFSKTDMLLVFWGGYTMLNALLKHVPISARLLELFGLTVFYFALRQINSSRYVALFIAMVIGGCIQAVYGNLQLWGYYPSHHGLFKMTGSFLNPGPFAGYLASIFPAALGLYMFRGKLIPIIEERINHTINFMGLQVSNRFKPLGSNIVKWIIVFSIITILMVLPVSGSRAAWMSIVVSSVILLYAKFSIKQFFIKFSKLNQAAILLLIFIIVGAAFWGIFQYKPASANGRLLVWKVTSSIVADHTLTGVGFDRFKAYYMDKQAEYFKQKPESLESMVAGDTNYCFNEFLQHTAENGIVGLILVLIVLINVFIYANSNLHNNLILISKAGLIGIIIFSLFSYPTQVLPIKINFTCYLACISTFSTKKNIYLRTTNHVVIKFILMTLLIGSVIILGKLTHHQKAWKAWGEAYQLQAKEHYSASLQYYEKAWESLRKNGDYLTNYGKALSLGKEYEQAVNILEQASLYFPNTIVYTTLGDCYKGLERTDDAEYSYLKAWHMNPSRFYPKYLLAKLYDETGQKDKAIIVAKELLNKNVKIHSIAIEKIKEEMNLIINKEN